MSGRDILRETVLSSGQRFSWRRAVAEDAGLVWQWWTAPHAYLWSVERRLDSFGEPPFTQEHVRRYLMASGAAESSSPRAGDRLVEPVIGSLADVGPVAYAEFYWRAGSPLASSRLLDDGARGMHMVVGKTSGHPRWMVVEVSLDALDWQFSAHRQMTQGIADPDVRNVPMRVLCERLGMREIGIVEMPGKVARIMAISRDEWFARRAGAKTAPSSQDEQER
jgi:hypothetical protein